MSEFLYNAGMFLVGFAGLWVLIILLAFVIVGAHDFISGDE